MNYEVKNTKKKSHFYLEFIENCSIFALAITEEKFLKNLQGGLPEWLTEQFAKLSTRKGRKGSNPLPSATKKIRGVA